MALDIHAHRILILDFGSQYTQLIARRVREIGVYCELHPFDMDDEAIREFAPKGVILAGGPESVHEANSPRCPQAVFDLGVPVFGICYGMQTMAEQLGGKVEGSELREFGYARVDVVGKSRLLDGIEDHIDADGLFGLDVWMSHGDKVTKMPEDFHILASTPSCPIAGMFSDERRYYGVQFHPEVTHTKQGGRILSRFILDICECEALWTPSKIAEDAIAQVRAQVGTDNVLLGLSGGVDSSVVAALLHKAIGDQLTCVFVDNGLLRLNERAQVEKMFRGKFKVDLRVVDASAVFLRKLKGVTDPERKRKIIGHEFIKVFERSIAEVQRTKKGKVDFLAQGTLYPDVIESLSPNGGPAATIKSHHNVGGLPKHMKLKLLEPLRELFKDEVRALGEALGLPHDMVWRHPFPGPGLAVRVCGDITKERLEVLRKADDIFINELRTSGQYAKVWQAFAVFLPVRSVGVMGDGRTYDNVCALRAVTSSDAMTADWARLPYDVLQRASTRIINEVKGINRVVYDVSSKPPATIEWE